MKSSNSLSHTKWDCKYHVVWIPKYRKKVIYGKIKIFMRDVLHKLVNQRESKIIEGTLKSDHIHMLISIPPKYSVSQVVGFLKGKSAIHIARNFGNQKNSKGQSFWARGYYVSTVGLDEETIKSYIRKQEKEDKRFEQLELFQ